MGIIYEVFTYTNVCIYKVAEPPSPERN